VFRPALQQGAVHLRDPKLNLGLALNDGLLAPAKG